MKPAIYLSTNDVLKYFHGNVSLASKVLGIQRTAFYPAIQRGYFGHKLSQRILIALRALSHDPA
ncbi:helix-turn-helix domain-containing protein [uncultured Thiothrix sp.]|uniref:helix-turn-helix domain-containing protein n=1 Tax=uncultured Thiothrix sp. TaxID=223185 RepID=UPI002612BEB3|nr:helix-turn-helix domain-containing protein [uncultured Thiothrix sp.]